MHQFEPPVIKVEVFEVADVITASGFSYDDSGFNNTVVKP